MKVLQEEQKMNILVIGNGFDLAHELPTKYIDFLKLKIGLKIDAVINAS